MTDSRNPPECADVLKLLDFPLSAYEISHLLKCSLRQTMERIRICWWSIVPVTGDYQGFKYARRPTHSARAHMPKEIGQFNDQGISPSSPRGHVSDRVR